MLRSTHVDRFTGRTVTDAPVVEVDNPVTSALRAALSTARGTAWFNDDWRIGVDWVRQTARAAAAQRSRVTTSGLAPITFTSRQGEVPITVVNRTAAPTVIHYKDGHGRTRTETVDVVTPFVGQLQTDLPKSFTNVTSPRAVSPSAAVHTSSDRPV